MRRPSGIDASMSNPFMVATHLVLAMAGLFALIWLEHSGLAAVQPQRHL